MPMSLNLLCFLEQQNNKGTFHSLILSIEVPNNIWLSHGNTWLVLQRIAVATCWRSKLYHKFKCSTCCGPAIYKSRINVVHSYTRYSKAHKLFSYSHGFSLREWQHICLNYNLQPRRIKANSGSRIHECVFNIAKRRQHYYAEGQGDSNY